MKAKYPMAAFAFAAVLYSTTVMDALVSGMIIFFAVALGTAVRLSGGGSEKSSTSATMATFLGGTAALLVSFVVVLKNETNWQYLLGLVAMAALAAKYVMEDKTPEDVSGMRDDTLTAVCTIVFIGAVRELWGSGTLMGTTLIDSAAIASGIVKPMFGCIFAGLGIAFVNSVNGKSAGDPWDFFWVAIPVAVISAPFTLASLPLVLSIVIAAAAAVVMVISMREKMLFCGSGAAFKALPVEMISLGIVYMVLTIL